MCSVWASLRRFLRSREILALLLLRGSTDVEPSSSTTGAEVAWGGLIWPVGALGEDGGVVGLETVDSSGLE